MTASDFDKAFGSDSAASDRFVKRVRRDGPEPANDDHKEPADDTAYKAFGYLPTNSVGETCDVRYWIGDSDVAEGTELQYRFLMRVGYICDEEIRLYLPECIVVIEGKNLRDLRKKLARRQVTFIQQFSRRIWKAMPNSSEPIVARISVVLSS